MNALNKAVLIWGVGLILALVSLVLPHNGPGMIQFIVNALILFLFAISMLIVRNEQSRRTRNVFLNFTLLFSLAIPFHFYSFIGPLLFPDALYARFYFVQYVADCLYSLLLLLASVYLTVDLVFEQLTIYKKYALTLSIVVVCATYFYYPYFINPKHAYQTEDVRNFTILDQSSSAFRNRTGSNPMASDLLEAAVRFTRDDRPGVVLNDEQKLAMVNDMLPYLRNNNYVVLLYKPVHASSIYMSVCCIGFLLTYFVYQRAQRSPHDKSMRRIVFMFLLLCLVEAMHRWLFIHSVEWERLARFMVVGQYISGIVLLLTALFFALRLREISLLQVER